MNYDNQNYHHSLPLLPILGNTSTEDVLPLVGAEAFSEAGLQVEHFLVSSFPIATTMEKNRIMTHAGAEFNQNVPRHPTGNTDSFGDTFTKDLYQSENGIPPQMLNDIFQLDDAMATRGKRHGKGPVKPRLTMAQYERELVAEMEALFPSTTPKSRLMQELTKIGDSSSTCPMNLHFRGGNNVDLVDSQGRQYRARFCGPIPTGKQTQLVYRQNSVPIKSHDINSAVYTELTKPTMPGSQIEASNAVGKPKTIIIKAPKRTIASSNGEGTGRMSMNSSDGEALQQEFKVISSTPMVIPTLSATTTSSGKQSRKQQLKSLAQCDVIFNEGIAEQPQGGASGEGKATPGTSCPSTADKDTCLADRPTSRHPRFRTIPQCPPTGSGIGITPFKKRTETTNRLMQNTSKCDKLPTLSAGPIEIIDSSDDSQEIVVDNKSETTEFLGKTDSVQCPVCFKVFFSSNSLMTHNQSCVDVILELRKQSSFSGVKTITKTTDRVTTDKRIRKRKHPSSKEQRCAQLSIEVLPTAFNIANLLVCDVCQKSFRAQEQLETHKRIHKTPTVCQYCRKKFYEAPLKHVCQERKRSMM
ncbi:uncharacterized protein LOC129778293 isoform X2 [Toxorhynchites rutilus septentrionalis]|uniref:uncharacterized protein LOC129778293 isoform X2 n=1 Tax=Toxorhynchites rutilus septentrionalis TaxID=329112 RepID=UPI00247941E7|nr:uncharacterized protein LOC129778293 isoform X2 [Toxorhynchites rutilus septentrionalis]